MHEPVRVNVEDYLGGARSLPGQFTAHLMECEACRQEVAALKEQSSLLRTLRSREDVEARPGFYARVIERIDAQRQSSIWSIFLEPAFGRRLALASAALAMLMGLYLVSSEPGGAGAVPNRTAHTVFLPGEDAPGPLLVLGNNQDQDRGAVLANLAAYRQSPEQ